MADFTFRHGAMGSGKSRDLMRIHFDYSRKYSKIIVLTSQLDTRAGVDGKINSRDGASIEATPIGSYEDLQKVFREADEEIMLKISLVLIDEINFFQPDWITEIKRFFCVQRDIPVIAFGLKVDFQGNLWPGTIAAMAVAENIVEVETVCRLCSRKATMNLRFSSDGTRIYDGEQILIGGDDSYIPVCAPCYYDGDKLNLEYVEPTEQTEPEHDSLFDDLD